MPYKILELYDQEPEQVEPYDVKNESFLGGIGRNISRTGSRAIETALGTPKAGYDILQMLGEYVPESAKTAASMIHPAGGFIKSLVSNVGPLLPSSEDVRETIAKTTQPGYLEPQGSGEELADTITKATTSLLLGKAKIPGIPTSAKGAIESLTSALKTVGKTASAASSGQAAKFLSKKLGAGEFGQEATNIATTLLVGAGLDANFRKSADQIYKIRDEAIKPGQGVIAQPILNKTNEARHKFLDVGIKGLEGKTELSNIINSIEEAVIGVNEHHIPLDRLYPIKEQAGEVWSKLPKGKAKKWVGSIYNELKETLNDPKRTGNKVFSEAQKAGDELYTHIKSAEKAANFAKGVLSSTPVLASGAAGALYGLVSNPAATLQNAALGVGGIGSLVSAGHVTWQTGLLMKNILTNPAVRKEYMHMVQAASKENVGQFIKSAEKFNKAAEKSKKPRYKILELY